LGQQSTAASPPWIEHLQEVNFSKGDVLLRQGEVPTTVKVVKTGMLLALRGGEDGVDRPIGILGCGQLLGSTALLGQPAGLTCQALSNGRWCEVPVTALQQTGLHDAQFLQALALAYAQTHERMADWARVVRARTAMGQLAGTLLQLSILQRSTLVRLPSHHVLAALLATTRETIARTLRQLADNGCLLRRDRWHCEIQRQSLLALCAERSTAA